MDLVRLSGRYGVQDQLHLTCFNSEICVNNVNSDCRCVPQQSILRFSRQVDSGGKFNILEGVSVGRCERRFHTKMYLNLNVYPGRAV
jgi:hypothetical protein